VPFDYLNTLFTELPKMKQDDDLAELLPWEIIPDEIKVV
jgi:hypothetical protein